MLRLLRHGTRIIHWLLAHSGDDFTESRNRQNHIRLRKLLCRQLFRNKSFPSCFFIWNVISEDSGFFWSHSSVIIQADNLLKTVSTCRPSGIKFRSFWISRQFPTMLPLTLQVLTSALFEHPRRLLSEVTQSSVSSAQLSLDAQDISIQLFA